MSVKDGDVICATAALHRVKSLPVGCSYEKRRELIPISVVRMDGLTLNPSQSTISDNECEHLYLRTRLRMSSWTLL